MLGLLGGRTRRGPQDDRQAMSSISELDTPFVSGSDPAAHQRAAAAGHGSLRSARAMLPDEHPLPTPSIPFHAHAHSAAAAVPFWDRRVARLVFCSFVLTFIIARLVVLLIMLRFIPRLYLHLNGTHVHHFNYGIILLASVGAYLLFRRPHGWRLSASAVLYGVGLALIVDEFSMWTRLGGPYWQRASFDAAVAVASMLGLAAFFPIPKPLRLRHWLIGLLIGVMICAFGTMLTRSVRMFAYRQINPVLEQIEARSP